MSIYGISFGVGFAVGPLFVPLIKISETLPFIVSSLLCLLAWSLVFLVKNEKPEALVGDASESGFKRYKLALRYGWIAFLPPFVYGFLESSLHALFPVYALRKSFEVEFVSVILAAFSIGAIVTQFPIGLLGDKIGRWKVISVGLVLGSAFFVLGNFLDTSEKLIVAIFLFAGMSVGSMFSLGITYMADLTPKELLPTGNLLCGIFFSLGSLSGPFIGGVYLEMFPSNGFLLLIAIMLFGVATIVFIFGRNKKLI